MKRSVILSVAAALLLLSCGKDKDDSNPLPGTTWSGHLSYLVTPYDLPEPFSLSFTSADSLILELKDRQLPGSYQYKSSGSKLELKLKGYDQLVTATLKNDSLTGFSTAADMNLRLVDAQRFTGLSKPLAGSKWSGNVNINFISATTLAWGTAANSPQSAYTLKGNVLRFKRNNGTDGSFGVFFGKRLDGCEWFGGNVDLWVAFGN